MSKIVSVDALEILDSRGYPTLQVTVRSDKKAVGVASIPSGASTGINEAVELRDKDPKRYGGKGVLQAVRNVTGPLAQVVVGQDVFDQTGIDRLMIAADGTENKSRLGANAILGISLATARAAAQEKELPLYRYLGKGNELLLPIPMINIINGGVHADNSLDVQEFLIYPKGALNFSEAIRWSAEVFHTLKWILKERGEAISVGDEGGFAPNFPTTEEALEMILLAIEKAGFTSKQISLALDPAASEFFDEEAKRYVEKKKKAKGLSFTSRTIEEQVEYLAGLIQKYPIDSIEDGLAESDWDGWKLLTQKLGKKIQLVGDDIFVTNSALLKKGIQLGVANAILIKLNQIGTLTETMECIQLAKSYNYATIISHRSGETEDSFIADLAVATCAGQIKTGSLSRSERIAKYNRLLTIEKELGKEAKFGIYTARDSRIGSDRVG